MLINRQDLLYAIRSARRAPLLTLIVVVALSVGIGLNAGVFTILNYLFLQSPTKKDVSSFVQAYPRYEGWLTSAGQFSSFTTEDYDAIRTQSLTLSAVAASEPTGAMLDDAHKRSPALLVTCNYFRVYGIERPLMGRFFRADECKPGTTERIVVLSEHVWKNHFAANPQIIGKVIHLNREPFIVVGIASDNSANFIPGGLWVPYTLQPVFDHGSNLIQNPDTPWLTVVGRLKQGYFRMDAKSELETILHQQDRLYLQRNITTLDRKTSLTLTNGSFIRNPAVQSMVMMLMALIMGPLSLVLMLACTNVTMLFLSRSVVRRGEIAIRLALGGGRARLVRMLVIESFLTAALAGVISVYLAYRVPILIFGVIAPSEAKFAGLIQPNWMVFSFLALLVLIATVVSALAPMRESLKLDLVTALKGRDGAATMRSRTTNAMIIAQLAMSFVLLTAAVLFARLPAMVTGIDPGFETRQTMTVPLDVETPPYTKTSGLAFYRTLESRILQIPGVQSLSYASLQPFRQAPPNEIRLPNQSKGQGRPASVDIVSSDFFSTFGIQLLHGRSFLRSDTSATTSAPVAIVSEAFAKAFWGDQDPLGKTLITPDDRRLVIIGVASDTRSEHFGILDGPRLYTLRDPQSLDVQLFVRFTGDAAPIAASIEEIVKTLDTNQVDSPETIWQSLESDAEGMRSLAKIILFMAGIAIVLAITGIYGVLSFSISQRTREFGIQMVLGASRQSIFRSVMVRGLRQIAIGLLCGLALAEPAAWALARLSKNSPMPIKTFDLSVYGIAALVLLVVSLSAMYLPAFRATQVDPMQALRNE